VDVAAHETIREEGDVRGEAYRKIEAALRRVRDE
jgi:hypothetical protein